jgi:hypothetical protein
MMATYIVIPTFASISLSNSFSPLDKFESEFDKINFTSGKWNEPSKNNNEMGLSKTLKRHSNQLTLLNEMKNLNLSCEIRLKKKAKMGSLPTYSIKGIK